MRLSEADRKNIEALEVLDIDEQILYLLLARYFGWRGQYNFSPDRAWERTSPFAELAKRHTK